MAHAYVDLAIAHFVPRRRRVRHNGPIYSDCFDTIRFHDAGIENAHQLFPSRPRPWRFADLFSVDEEGGTPSLPSTSRCGRPYTSAEFWRHHDGRRGRPAMLPMPWGKIPLWGDENVYRWSRGTLGPHVLGSAYLALDDWIAQEADKAGQSRISPGLSCSRTALSPRSRP